MLHPVGKAVLWGRGYAPRMWTLLLASALAGDLVVEAKVPARVSVDTELVAEIFRSGSYRTEIPDGPHKLVITTGGTPKSFDIEAGPEPVVVIVGRTGTTLGTAAPEPETVAKGDADIVFRSSDGSRLMVQVGPQRVVVGAGRDVALSLPVGEYPMSVRNESGTQIFARGMLDVRGGTELIVQVAEGTLPETAGDGVAFHAVGR